MLLPLKQQVEPRNSTIFRSAFIRRPVNNMSQFGSPELQRPQYQRPQYQRSQSQRPRFQRSQSERPRSPRRRHRQRSPGLLSLDVSQRVQEPDMAVMWAQIYHCNWNMRGKMILRTISDIGPPQRRDPNTKMLESLMIPTRDMELEDLGQLRQPQSITHIK